MTAHEIHALSGAYAVDALDDLERARFEAHLAVCAECQAEVTSLQEATLLMTGLTEVAPSDAMRAQVLAGIKKVRPLPPVVARIERRRPRRWVNLVAAAAVLGVVGTTTAVVVQQNRDSNSSTPPVANPRIDAVLAASDLNSITKPFSTGGTATVSWSTSEHGAVLDTHGLRTAPAGHVYELWFQKNGTMVPAGLLTKTGDQRTIMAGDPAGATAVGVTLEPDGGSKKPTSPTIALLNLTT